MDKRSKLHPETIKVLEEKVGNTPQATARDTDFLEKSPKAKAVKTKINKWDYIKLKSLCAAKETINKVKKQPTEWGKQIFAHYTGDKGIISRIYKELKNNQNNKTNKPVKMGMGNGQTLYQGTNPNG